jgi:hypothetical protein
MNERIQKLERQAMISVLNGNDPDGDVDRMYISAEFTKKFAELIVRECAGVGYDASYYECALNVSNKIKQHFGVKE